jgi:cell division protein FtsZ
MAGTDLTMAEINRVMEHVNGKCSKAQVIMGAAVNSQFQERLLITVIATRHSEPQLEKAGLSEAAHSTVNRATEFDTQLHLRETSRPQSRFVPPPPTLTPDKMEQLAARQSGTGGRSRKAVQRKMRQEQLPLEIVSKGRFDKSEPTIHKGEDLDVPTYIRRGVSLN